MPVTILSHYHLAQSSVCPLTISSFCQFTLCPVTQCHLAPLWIRPFTTLPNPILPIYHLTPISFHNSVSLNRLTTAHDFLILEPKPGKDSKNPCLLFLRRTRIVNLLNCEFDDLQTDTDMSKWTFPSRQHGCTGHTSLSFLRLRIS